MEIIIEDDEFIASYCYGCVNTAKKEYENGKLVGYKRIGEFMLSDEFDYETEESLISMAELCIKYCSRAKIALG